MTPEGKKYFWEKASYNFTLKNFKTFLRKELRCFTQGIHVMINGPWNLSVNSFHTKCLILPDNAFQIKS